MSIEPGAQLRHELRTPLNHIIGYAELLLEELEAGDQPELAADLAALRADARQLLTLLNEVLARGQTGPPDLAAARGTLGPPLDRVRAAGESLHRRAAAAGAAARLADLDRIRAATVRLDELLGGTARSASPDGGPAPDAGDAADSPAPPRAVILVVDDGEDNRDMLARRLRRQGYEVQTAAGGRAALAALAESPVDLVLLDVMMPDLDGYAVLERLKADPTRRDIPVLMISALDDLDSVVRCIQLGAEDYLGKPFDPVLLQARIGACLEKKRLHDQEARQRRELAALNQTLERRVADQVAQLERLGRLKRFFSPQLAELIVAGGAADPLSPHRREITVVFVDLRGFTAFAEIRRARGADGRAARVSRGDGPSHPRPRGHARALHRRRHDGLLQRPGRGAGSGPAGDPHGHRDARPERRARGPLAEARLGPGPRGGHRAGLRHHRRHRLRGAGGLRRDRDGHESRGPPVRRGRAAGRS